MLGSENNIIDRDVFIFELPTSNNVYDSMVEDYCNNELYVQGHNVFAAVVHDQDFTYFEDIVKYGLNSVLATLVNESMATISAGDEEYYTQLLSIFNNDENTLGWVIFNYLWAYHYKVLQYVPQIFRNADNMNKRYTDFTISESVNSITIRLNIDVIGQYVGGTQCMSHF